MRFAVVLMIGMAAIGAYLYVARPLFLPVEIRGPQTEDEIAFATCDVAVQEILKAPASFKRLDGGAHIQDGDGTHLEFEAFLTSVIFEFTAANTYGTDTKSIADCDLAWAKVPGGRARNPMIVELRIDGHPLDELDRLRVMTRLMSVEF